MAKLVFFTSSGLLLFSYLLYPLLLSLLSARGSPEADQVSARTEKWPWPSISVLVAAYNEERVIADKIANFFGCERFYPGPSELIIVSDGSTDRTVELASAAAGGQIRVLVLMERGGKGKAINRAAEMARGEILVFTDANAFFTEESLSELIGPFADPRVGLVTGCSRYPGGIGSLYQRYERMLKRLEARGGVIATADGALYAMRHSLWRRHDPALVNDFFHPILVNLQGARAVIAPKAICVEDFSVEHEFQRQVRMVALASFAYRRVVPELLRARKWRSLLVLTSHKLVRWLTVPLLVAAFCSSLSLASLGEGYALFIAVEMGFMALAALGVLARVLGLNERLSIVYHFIALNLAAALGLSRSLLGNTPTIWQPRSQ